MQIDLFFDILMRMNYWLKNKLFFLLVAFSFLFSGCVPVLIGAGVAGGYALGSDSATGRVSVDYPFLWDLCIEVLQEKDAEFLAMNQARGHMKALVFEHAVTIRLDSITPKTQRLRVAARRYFMPRPQFAQEIFFEILDRLR